ncbi:DUF3955 domain-containing protein [Lysinibacillus sp. FSL K6-0057]|jgi:hypothetical protein|uniref:DUF3955 domain-containing protein n=1 Tax=unclassified Lysinibacillus TaxID=2636778 RepID=UPI0031594932
MKKYLLATIPMIMGIVCLFIKGIIGDEILADGTIVEKNFFLIPLSYLFFFSGILTFLIMALFSTFKKQTTAS